MTVLAKLARDLEKAHLLEHRVQNRRLRQQQQLALSAVADDVVLKVAEVGQIEMQKKGCLHYYCC